VPFALVWYILAWPFSLCSPSARPPRSNSGISQQQPDAKELKPRASRKYDVVLFGATGFTGSLAAKYLVKQYKNSGLKWAIAGRNQKALETVRAELNVNANDLDILIADASKPETLRALVADTRVVITTVGPFVRYGTPLVEACALFGTDYCDITGETDWVRNMIDKYDDIAKVSGARIVNFCGHDCVPWDLCAFKAAEALKQQGESMVDIKCFDEICGSASGNDRLIWMHLFIHFFFLFVCFDLFCCISSAIISFEQNPSISYQPHDHDDYT
jgi:hypothetical protein